MTKLEEKLLELGYTRTYGLYWKKIYGKASIIIKKCVNIIIDYYVPKESYLSSLDIEQAFNEMQKDLEILKGVENENN